MLAYLFINSLSKNLNISSFILVIILIDCCLLWESVCEHNEIVNSLRILQTVRVWTEVASLSQKPQQLGKFGKSSLSLSLIQDESSTHCTQLNFVQEQFTLSS